MKRTIFLFILWIPCLLQAQDFVKTAGDVIILDNGFIHREISLSGNRLSCSVLLMNQLKDNFISRSREFSFTVNGKKVDGDSGWKLISADPITDSYKGKGIRLVLQSENDFKIKIGLNYLLYPGLPLVRKWISIRNTGGTELCIEDLNIEDLETSIDYVTAMVYHNYGRMKQIGLFEGNWDDPVVVLHDMDNRRGIAVGNEAPGVLKRTAYHTERNNLETGLTHSDQGIPFRKWLKPDEEWESPLTFLCLYTGTDNGFDVINGDVSKFIERHLGARIVTSKEKPVFVYNTWNPFRTFVNDSLIREVAKAASECGIQEFIIDDGWQVNEGSTTSAKAWGNNYGDWLVDQNKFAGGLKPTFDFIRSLGMKPGLWISIGSATTDAKVYKDHPEWFVKNIEGRPGNLHQGNDNAGFVTSCLGTGWVDYIKNKIINLVTEYGLAYAKLDFSVVTSAYVSNDTISGCYATDHPYHKDHRESFIVIYERLLKLFDDLHAAAPDLFIDCTFETAGKLQLMDYAIAEHAEGNWLSNIEQPFPTGALRARQLAWWRSPAVPASSLVIGNLKMNEETFEFSLKSLIGSLPIVLGDPRKLTPEKRAAVKKWSLWMQDMQKKHDYMSFRKDLPGFDEPAEGMWDGWSRLNFNTREGGIFGVFRQGAAEEHRTIILTDLDPLKTYMIKIAPEGKVILSETGKKLMEEGFEVTLPDKYDGKIYEVALK
jgi:alpha-galactosidase